MCCQKPAAVVMETSVHIPHHTGFASLESSSPVPVTRLAVPTNNARATSWFRPSLYAGLIERRPTTGVMRSKAMQGPEAPPKAKVPHIKPKRDPLPMKLRALPSSFWQQPNHAGGAPPSGTPMPALTSVDAPEDPPGDQEVSRADTDLLFSLFSTLPKPPQPGVRAPARRGRPPKKGNKAGAGKAKDEDPYVTSATVPEVKFQKEAMAETKVLALMAFDQHNGSGSCNEWQLSYAQRLQELAVNL